MKLNNPFIKIQQLRKRIGATEKSYAFGTDLDELSEIKINLATEGIEVARDEIKNISKSSKEEA